MEKTNSVYFSIIIPAYNEERRLLKTLTAVFEYVSRQAWTWEILIMSDGSQDTTVNIAQSFKHSHPLSNIIVVENQKNHGKGFVVRQGMCAATGSLRLFMDADNATHIEEIEKLLPYTKQHDVVIGSLGVTGAVMRQRETLIRIMAGKLGNLFIRFLLLPGIYDTQRGFKLFTTQAAEHIFPRLRIDRWGFDVEVLVLAKKFGFLIKEAPITWTHQPESKVRFFSYCNVFIDVLRIRWWVRRSVYNSENM